MPTRREALVTSRLSTLDICAQARNSAGTFWKGFHHRMRQGANAMPYLEHMHAQQVRLAGTPVTVQCAPSPLAYSTLQAPASAARRGVAYEVRLLLAAFVGLQRY